MSEKIATIIGATGMIGNYLLEEILADDYFDIARVIVRRPYEKKHPKLEVKLVDFSDTESLKLALDGSDAVFSCIGTTQKNVKGNHSLYRQIDFDIPLKAARLCKELGCEKFILVSAVGANHHSNTFYLKLKGELENAIRQTELRSIHIMQPSQLLGERKEKRTGESILQGSMKTLSGIFVGSLRKYRAIHGKTVAKAMLNAAKKNEEGFYRYTYDGIKEVAEMD
ncbi:NAD(P)H-binding protein [Terrimonas pollutisoli]|uniref:NAD(P)H-binding protein n=1 Tax=Terrimonas pollutisoli TaxID=3034147 RepID=UPI0023EABED5|nr:NAD(P)H-binding protein [Terrimonas sp. H1YJ31]